MTIGSTTDATSNYSVFLNRKSQIGKNYGFNPIWMPDFLYGFQKFLVEWSTQRGRGA